MFELTVKERNKIVALADSSKKWHARWNVDIPVAVCCWNGCFEIYATSAEQTVKKQENKKKVQDTRSMYENIATRRHVNSYCRALLKAKYCPRIAAVLLQAENAYKFGLNVKFNTVPNIVKIYLYAHAIFHQANSAVISK